MKKMILVIFTLILICSKPVKGDEYISLEDFDLSAPQQIINEEKYNIDIDEVVTQIMHGDIMSALNEIIDGTRFNVKREIGNVKGVSVSIFFTAILAALLSNFNYAVSKSGIKEMGFYACYILQISILLYVFQIVCTIGKNLVILIIELMTAILPAYMLSVGLLGQATAAGFHSFILMIITCIEVVVLKCIFPILKIYMVICLVNSISKEDLLSKTSELIKRFIIFTYKCMFGIITGINVIQGLILPLADNAKNNIFKKMLASIPMVGNGTETVAEIIINSANIIKNSIGVLAIILIAAICIIPIAKAIFYSAMLQISAAMLQPLCDSRIIKSITYTYEGIKLVNQAMSLVAFLFVVTITIICISTGING